MFPFKVICAWTQKYNRCKSTLSIALEKGGGRMCLDPELLGCKSASLANECAFIPHKPGLGTDPFTTE